MAGIVRARGEFVDEEGAGVGEEKFDGEQADETEFVGDANGESGSIFLDGERDAGRDDGEVEDVVTMLVFGDRKRGGVSEGVAGDNDGKFARVNDPLFEDGFWGVELLPDIGGREGAVDFGLAFAVVTEIGGFQDDFAGDGCKSQGKFGGGSDDAEGHDGVTVRLQEVFFAFAILADVQDVRAGMDGAMAGDVIDDGGRDVFKLECDNIDGLGEGIEHGEVAVRGDEFAVGDLSGRTVGLRLECVDAVTHFAGGEGKHPSELSAAEQADGGAGWNGGGGHGNAEWGMRNAECGDRRAESGMRKVERGMWKAEREMGNGECGVGNAGCWMRSAG